MYLLNAQKCTVHQLFSPYHHLLSTRNITTKTTQQNIKILKKQTSMYIRTNTLATQFTKIPLQYQHQNKLASYGTPHIHTPLYNIRVQSSLRTSQPNTEPAQQNKPPHSAAVTTLIIKYTQCAYVLL